MFKALRRFFRGRAWSHVPLIALVAGGGIYAWNHRHDYDGFNPDWPDAIQCKLEIPFTMQGPVPYVFYYIGVSKGRKSLSDVVRYALPGSSVDPKTGLQNPLHEIWFRIDDAKPLVRGTTNATGEAVLKFGARTVSNSDLDEYGQRYLTSFPDGGAKYPLDCGGDSIGEIAKSGNAFTFARRFQ